MMFNLENFKKIGLAPGYPSISFTKYGMTFNKNAIIKIGEPEKACLYIDEEEQVIAITAASNDDDKSLPFMSKGKKVMSVRWNHQDLLQTIEQLMDWDRNIGYRIHGYYDKEQKALFFDLKKASYLSSGLEEE